MLLFDIPNLPSFVDSLCANLTPLQQDLVFGYLLKRPGYLTSRTRISEKHKVQDIDVALADVLQLLKQKLAEDHCVYKHSDLPLPPEHESSKLPKPKPNRDVPPTQKLYRHNTSGATGVNITPRGKFVVHAHSRYVGIYFTFEEAVRARADYLETYPDNTKIVKLNQAKAATQIAATVK